MAMEGDIAPYTGLEKLDPAGQDSEERVTRRQRHSALSDAQLTNRRDQLIQFLEGAWGLIGWDLRKARKRDQVQEALARTNFENTGYRDFLMPFVRNSESAPDPVRMRALRGRMLRLGEKGYEDSQSSQIATEQFEKAKIALSTCSRVNLRTLKREYKKREQQANRATQAYARINKQRETLYSELQCLEGAFAQNELLRMVKSKRYSYTPLNLANGMAGLPYMGWRQSVLRCVKYTCPTRNGFWYQIFKLIRQAVDTAPQKTATAVTSQLERLITGMKDKKRRYVRDSLGENWFFLKRATTNICQSKHHPRALSFRITAEFQREVGSQSAENRVLADINKLKF